MTGPLTIDVPHRLGKDGARRRMRERVGELPGFLPSGVAETRTSWTSEDVMAVDIAALGQTLGATMEVMERCVRVRIALPPALGFLSGLIAGAVERKGTELLEDKRA